MSKENQRHSPAWPANKAEQPHPDKKKNAGKMRLQKQAGIKPTQIYFPLNSALPIFS